MTRLDLDPRRPLILVRVRDEAPQLPDVIARLSRLTGVSVLLLDDASSDGSSALLHASGLPFWSFPTRRGRDGVLRAGLELAVRAGVERVVLLDGDGQHPPELAPRFLEGLRSARLVRGTRFSPSSPQHGTPPDRVLHARALGRIVEEATGWRLSDPACGMAAFRTSLLKDLSWPRSFSHHHGLELALRSWQAGLPREATVEFPIAAVYDLDSPSFRRKYAPETWRVRLLSRLESHLRRVAELYAERRPSGLRPLRAAGPLGQLLAEGRLDLVSAQTLEAVSLEAREEPREGEATAGTTVERLRGSSASEQEHMIASLHVVPTVSTQAGEG